jgi:signal transduction histidine kinase/ActR/RegA family two-component response regulator
MPRVALRRHLFVLAVAGILPLAALAGAGLAALYEQQRDAAQKRALEITRALASAVQSELQRSVSSLNVLASSASLQRGDLAQFEATARRAVATQPQWRTVILSRPSGEPIINTRVEPGQPLPEVMEPVSFARVVQERKPVVGQIAKGSERFAIPLRVPVMVGGELRYVITAVAKPESFLQILMQQQVPSTWVIAVFDSAGLRVARSRANEEFFATPASETLLALMASGGREGAGVTSAMEGDRIYTAFTRLPDSGWSVAIGIPVAEVNSIAARSTAIYAAAVTLSIVIGLLVAGAIARQITGATAQLGHAARRLGEGETPEVGDTGIREIQEVAEAITEAARQRSQIESERERLLASEIAARAEAEAANRAKDQFLAMLGHELRNPLAALSNASTLLAHSPTDPRMAMRAREVIQRQVAHLSRLTDDLLDAARAILGKIELRVEPVDLAAVTRQSLQTFAGSGRLAAHRVVESLEPAWISGDPVRLEQIVSNLVGNAVKYTPAGGIITVTTSREGGESRLAVSDTGIGLAPELAARAFDLFVQGERNLDRSEGGLGIGLTLVRRLAELHAGRVELASEGENRGAQFTVSFPAIEAPALPVPAPVQDRPAELSILLVEDNLDARETMKALLEAFGHQVRDVADGEEGIAEALARPPDLALVDLGLPKADGFEVARRIRASGNARTYLAALTGYGAKEDRARSMEAGFDTHITKPIELDPLQRVLSEAANTTARRAASG